MPNLTNIRVLIGPDGKAILDFNGFQGAACLDAARKLRETMGALGVEIEETAFEPKPELLNSLETSETERARQGQAQAE